MRNERIDEPITEAWACFQIPMAIIGEDNDKGLSFASENQLVERVWRAETNPLIGGVGLSMQEVEHGVTCIGLVIIAGWQINEIFLWWFGGCNCA